MAKKNSSLTLVSFRGMLFNLQVFWDFPVFLLLLTFSLTPLWAESRHCIIPIILNLLKVYFMDQNVAYLGSILCELGTNVYFVILDKIFYECQSDPMLIDSASLK